MRTISNEDYLEILSQIEDYHKVFFVFVNMADILFVDDIPTAAVRLPKGHKPTLYINEDFWHKLTIRSRLFVICHECLHVMLDHGVRNGLKIKGATPKLVNIAQDITINEMIVDLFGYDRNDLTDWKKFCWIDTCFENHVMISRNETFEYYLTKLIENPPDDASEGGPSVFDEHGLQDDGSTNSPGTSEQETEEEKTNRESLAETLAEELTAKEIESLIKGLPLSQIAGKLTSVLEHIIAKKIKKQKVNFKHIIRKLKKNSMKEVEKDVDTFTHDDRRFSDIILSQNASLPGKNCVPKQVKDRLLTAVFMDISGSCLQYIDIFQKVFLAFDEERKIFDTRLFIFDTIVKEVKRGDNVRIGGGTSFDIIEEKCLELESQGKRYPDCVIVITDGYGNKVEPKAASKWIWLLTPTDSTSLYVPIRSKKFFVNQVIFE